MKFEFILRIKEKFNPPKLKKDFGKGELVKQVVEFPSLTDDDLNKPSVISEIIDIGNNMMNDYLEVINKRID